MKKCRFCGTELTDEQKFCSSCGARVEGVVNLQNPSGDEKNDKENSTVNAEAVKKNRSYNGAMLAWSIVNAAVSLSLCCGILPLASFVLGVIAIVYTTMAKDSKSDEIEIKRIKTAKILNIIATCVLGVSIIFYIISMIALWGVGNGYVIPELFRNYEYYNW